MNSWILKMYPIWLSPCTVTHVDAHIVTSQARDISPDWLLCSFHESPSSLITALLTGTPCTVPTLDLELAVFLRSAVPVGGVWCLGSQSGCLRCPCLSAFQQAKEIPLYSYYHFKSKVLGFLLTFIYLYLPLLTFIYTYISFLLHLKPWFLITLS